MELKHLTATCSDGGSVAVVISAPAGMGKTRLVREVAERLDPAPLWVQASQAASAVPFGALAHVDGLSSDDAAATFRQMRADVAAGGGVVVVDDAPHLDERTADLLRRLFDAGDVTILATARADVAVPAFLDWLWLAESTEHLELNPLDLVTISELVDAAFGDATPRYRRRVSEAVAERSRGNALFVRELLADLIARRREHAEPEPEGDAPTHLIRVLQTRLGGIGDAIRPLQAVATLGSVPLGSLRAVTDDDLINAAEAGGWIEVDLSARAVVRPAHPLYAETALAMLRTVERVDLTERLARSVLDSAGATAGERLSAVAALQDLGVDVSVAQLLDGARSAFAALDHELAARLSQGAVDEGGGCEAHIVLGAAHSGAGREGPAESALRTAISLAGDDDQLARAAGRLSVHLVAFGNRIDEASQLLDGVDAQLTEPAAKAFLAADRAKLASIRGDLTAVATVVDESADDLSKLNSAIVMAYVHAMSGDADAGRSTIAAALPLAEAHSEVLPWSSELIQFSGPFAALLESGPEAARLEASAGGATTQAVANATGGTWCFLEGFAATVGGRLSSALEVLDRAVIELEGHDLINARPLAQATAAWASAQIGRVDDARARIELAVDAAAADGRVRTQLEVAEVWCDAFERGIGGGLAPRSVTQLVRAAHEAETTGQRLSALIVLHEMVRLGEPATAVEHLQRLTKTMPASWLTGFVVDRAKAQAAGDAVTVERLIRRAVGCWPVAVAELCAVRAHLAERSGDVALARQFCVLAEISSGELRGDEPGVALPVTVVANGSTLSPRELSVAQRVGFGASNRETAEHAGVSVRTVENQLQSIYRKLELAGRPELVALVGMLGGTFGAA